MLVPVSSTLQVFYALMFACVSVRFYDLTLNGSVPDPNEVPRGALSTSVFALVSANFILCLADITIKRMSPLYERHTEEELLKSFEQ